MLGEGEFADLTHIESAHALFQGNSSIAAQTVMAPTVEL
jgi:hypothetical protein